jgi:hypothetical protein
VQFRTLGSELVFVAKTQVSGVGNYHEKNVNLIFVNRSRKQYMGIASWLFDVFPTIIGPQGLYDLDLPSILDGRSHYKSHQKIRELL